MTEVTDQSGGGPAFPPRWIDSPGMSLRDYFAGQALAAINTWSPSGSFSLNTPDGIKARAEWAYAQADAMLEARKR